MTDEAQRVILIVDDDDQTREMYTEVFKQNNFEVIQAHDGVEGLEQASNREGIDVIFTGIDMPRMDGFSLITELKENPATSDIPVFMNSHMGREEDKTKAKELGVKDFIVLGMVPPKEVVHKVLQSFELNGKSYTLKVDPFEYDGQMFISDVQAPEDFSCTNCGSQLALKVINQSGKFEASIVCPNCNQAY